MLRIAHKWPNFALVGQFWLQLDFFASPPPIRLRPHRGLTGTYNFESPSIKNLEKKTLEGSTNILTCTITTEIKHCR